MKEAAPERDLSLERLTHASIKPFGYIIDRSCIKRDSGKENGFGVLLRTRSKGWRIAYLIVRKRVMTRLECHPDTLETFEPVKGRGVIALASHSRPKDVRFFILEAPIVLKKGIWHEVATLTREWEIKICENFSVKEDYYKLKNKIRMPRIVTK